MSLLATSSVSIVNVNDGQAYALQPSNSVVIMEEDGSYKPSQLSFQSVKLTGTGDMSSYSGRFKIERTSDETNWTTEYTSNSNEASVTYNMPSTTEEKVPYNFRATSNGDNVGSKAFDTIVGGTVAWNQQIYNSNFASDTGWANLPGSTRNIANNECVLTITANWGGLQTNGSLDSNNKPTDIAGHKYFISADLKSSENTGNTVGFGVSHYGSGKPVRKTFSVTTSYATYSFIGTQTTETVPQKDVRFMVYDTAGGAGRTLYVKNVMSIDLTQLFGSTVADYIYSLEQATAGAGVAWFKKLFPKDYYEYDVGTLKSVDGLASHDMVGFNAFNGVWNEARTINATTGELVVSSGTYATTDFIKILPNTSYYGRMVQTQHDSVNVAYYDINKKFLSYTPSVSWIVNKATVTPSNAFYMRITITKSRTSEDGFCISLSSDRNGEYEPYVKHTYPIDSTLALRGIPKLDAQNNLYYDGDEYLPDGTVTRRYGVVDLGTLTWNILKAGYFYSTSINTIIKKGSIAERYDHVRCRLYVADNIASLGSLPDKSISVDSSGNLQIHDSGYETVVAFKAAMSGVYLVYELATPTTETAEPYQESQIVDSYGTEEYVTTGIVPVGHVTKYTQDISSIRCSLYASGGTTTLLDQQIIPVVNDAESAVYMTKQIEEYRLSDSSTSITGSGDGYEWADTMPAVPPGKYLWKRLKSYFSNGSIAYSDAVCDIVMSGLVFDVDRNSNAITSKVWESDITNKINAYDGSTGAAIRDRVTQTETNISGITTRVSDVETTTDGLGTRMTTAESNITQNANNITTKVSKDGVISSINQSAETVKISASKVNIEGAVTFSSFDSTLQNRLTTAESDASTAKSNASSAVSTANTASSNASSALTKVNNSIKSTTMHYLATSASSGVTTSTSGWTTTIQSITKDKPYLWTYQTITKINDTTSNTDPVISGVYGATGGKGDTGTGVTKVEQLYRTSNSTTAPAAPTSAVSSTSTSYNTWTLAMPTYNTSYPYYYICTQTTYDNGTVKWTTVSRSKALEDANSTANTANTNASNAVTTANTANTNASNAVSTANTANTNASNAVTTANQAKSKADSAASLLSTWTGDATLATTTIDGGYIKTHTIESTHLATNAIMSQNYSRTDTSSPYSSTGAFLDLTTGTLYMPNFGVNGTTGASYFNGTVNANAGKFGDDTSYWNIETVYDYNMQPHAALVGTGSPYLQTGNWQVSDNAVATRKYTSTSESAGNATYYKDSGSNTFYDVGMKIPTNFAAYSASDSSVVKYNKAFYYGRKYTGNTIPSLDSDWTYFFSIDSGGNVITAGDVYEGGVKLSEKYAAISDVGSVYLPKTGGTITGNLTVNGSFTTNLQLQTNLGSTSSAQLTGAANAVVKPGVTGTLGVGNGGTGKSSWTANQIVYASASNTLSQLGSGTSGQILKSNGSSAPSWVNQSTLSVGSATKATQDGNGNVIVNTYMPIAGGQFTGAVYVPDEFSADSAQLGSLIVNGAARFTNDVFADTFTGNLVGTASNAVKVGNNLVIKLNGGSTEGTNLFTYNGSAAKTINITASSIGAQASGTYAGGISNGGAASKLAYQAGNEINFVSTADTQPTSVYFNYRNGYTGSKTGVSADYAYYFDNGNAEYNRTTLYAAQFSGNAATATTATTADKVGNNLVILLNSGTTEGTNKFTYNGSAAKNVNITKSGIGLGNVENTALSTWAGSANLTTTKVGTLAAAAAKGVDTSISAGSTSTNLPTSKAVATFVEGKGYVTSSGVTSITLKAGTGISLDTDNTAITSTGTRTISLANTYGDTQNPYGTKTKNYVLAGPTTGSATAPTFRALVADDIPTLTPGKAGLGNVTNNKQVKGLSSGTTSGHLVSWGADGYTVADSGIATSSVNKTVKSLASNNDGKIVLTYLDGTTSDPIEVKIIGSSGSSVSYADALNVNGTAVGGSEQPVYINNQGKPATANKIPKLNNVTTGGTFYAPTSAGTSGQILKSNGSGAPTWVNQNTLQVERATKDGDGNTISSTYLKLSGGTLTNPNNIFYNASQGSVITANSASVLQSPIPKYLWHDLWGFCKATTPKYYTTTDGSTWTEGTLEKRFFAHLEAWGRAEIIKSNGVIGSRWEWDGGGFAYCSGSWLVIGVAYANPIAKFDVLLEESADTGESGTWTTLCSSVGVSVNQQPVWIKTNGPSKNNIRLTITRNSESGTTTTLPIVSLRWLSYRWGDQGKGQEYEYPYTWDGDGNMTLKGIFTGTINTLNNTWNNIGDDIQIGDINKGGHLGIQGKNANTGIFFTTYGQTTKTVGGAITWDGSKFIITGTIDTSISGNAATASKANITTTINAIAKYNDTEGTFANSNVYIDSDGNVVIGSTDSSGNVSGAGNFKIGAKNDNYGIMPWGNNWNQIGSSSSYWFRGYINHYYGQTSHVTNWDAGKNIGTAATASAAATRGSVYFYNTCAANGTQTKTLLDANASTSSNITITLPSSTGTLALTSSSITGNAATATKWASAQTVYVALGTASKTTSIQGGSSSAVTLGVDGVLGVANGGTGAASFTANSVIMSGSSTTGAFTTRAVTNNTSASAVTANTNLITANTLAYWTGSSNLTTCKQGTFGAAATYSATTSVTSGSSALVTSGGVSTALGSYVTLSTTQTISGTKTFSASTSFTNTTASTSKSTGAVKVSGGLGVAGQISANTAMIGDAVSLVYDSSISALCFQFA